MARAKLPLVVLSILLALVAAYYFFHVSPRQEYLAELDFRRLGAMAERIDMALGTYRQVVANAAKSPGRLPRPLELVGPWPEAEPGEPWVEIADAPLPNGRWIRFQAGRLQARLRVEDLVRPALESDDSFDKLFFATSEGQILYQAGPGKIELRTLAGLELKRSKAEDLWRSTALEDVVISGRKYKLFVQPCATAGTQSEANGWMIGALMRTSRFQVRSFRISANLIILFCAFALLSLLALPFLKLLTIGAGGRLRAVDGLLAALCALVGLSVLMVLLLDRVVYAKLEDTADKQVKDLAWEIRKSFLEDLDSALQDLQTRQDKASRESRDAGSGAEPVPENRIDFFWVDQDGEQILKWTHKDKETPLINVRDRLYFRDAIEGQLQSRPRLGKPGKPHEFALESVRSWTTGENVLEISMPVEEGRARDAAGLERRAAVAVLTTRAPSVHQAVLPPGFGFAVIDAAGTVLFHSDPRRMLQENFLEEAGSTRLRSRIANKRSGLERVLYMGRQHEVYAVPMPDLPWTVLTFRDKTLLRATNVQIVTTSLVFLTAYTMLFLLLFTLTYLASSTRARWLWPAVPRQGTYLHLAVFYAFCLGAYLLLLLEGEPVYLLLTGMLVPLLVLFVSYVKVSSDEQVFEPKQKVVAALVLAAAVALIGVGAIRVRYGLDPKVWIVSVAALGAGGAFLFHPSVTGLFRRRLIMPVRGAYLACAMLLLTVLTALPAASFFKLACDVPVESMVKNNQLKLMQQIEKELLRRHAEKEPADARYAGVFFETEPGRHCPKAERAARPQPGGNRQIRKASLHAARQGSPRALDDERPQESPHVQRLVEFQERLFPMYSADSSDLARLSQDGLADRDEWPWHWEHLKAKRPQWTSVLRLHREAGSRGPALHLTSTFPSVKPALEDWGTLALGMLLLSVISLGLVSLMADKLMLLRSGPPLWLSRRRLSLWASTDNLFCVTRQPHQLRGGNRAGAGVVDLAAAEEDVLAGKVLESAALQGKRLVLVKRFEHRIDDRGFNWAKLELLEALLAGGGRRIVVLSEQDPHLCLASGLLCGGGEDPDCDRAERERWRLLLGRFVTINLDLRTRTARELPARLERARKRLFRMGGSFRLERASWKRHVEDCLRIVRAECSLTAQLEEIGMDLLSDLGPEDLEQARILDEIRTRAEGYYWTLWESLSDEEKVVLLQLADEGLANPKSLRPFENLVARGLVRRDPSPRLMNETFRQFVVRCAPREKVKKIEAAYEQESTWGRLRGPLAAGMTAALLFFGFTQRDAFNTTFAVISTFAGALPHLLQLVGYLASPKSALPRSG